jgi:CubicO group peptidase (beta-lactamase class C family)
MKDVIPGWGLMDPVADAQADLIDLLSECWKGQDLFYGSVTSFLAHPPSLTLGSADEPIPTLVSRMRHLRPSSEFRQDWQYTNLAYMVASRLPEILYGVAFTTYVQDNILTPLGMEDTGYDLTLATGSGNRADGFHRRHMDLSACAREREETRFGAACRGQWEALGWYKPVGEMDAGSAGVITSARDMVCLFLLLAMRGH